MKILKLNFSNLNSLKGKFSIDFESPALANAGLFAITGPTGAGKSTILDAITLALYSYTSRLQEITKTTIEDKKGIITRGTKEAYAEITFLSNGEKYLSQWSAGLTKNETLRSIMLKVSIEVNGEFVPIADKLKESRAKIIEIIGLTQEQFTQAIVLSQGKFDEFLKAKDADRYKLLEIITGTGFFREIGKLAFQRFNLIKEDIKNLNGKMGMISVMSEDEWQLFQEEQQNLQQKQAGLNELMIALDAKKQIKEKIIELEKNDLILDAEHDALIIGELELSSSKEKLSAHERTESIMPTWNESLVLEKEMLAEKKKKDDANNAVALLHKQCDGILQQFKIESGEETNAENFETSLENFCKKVSAIDVELTKIEAGIDAGKTALNGAVNNFPEPFKNDIKKIAKEIDKLDQYLLKKQQEMMVTPLPVGINMADPELAIKIQQQRILNLIDCATSFSDYQKKEKEKFEEGETHKKQAAALTSVEKELDELNKKIEKENTTLETLKKAVDANNAVMSMEIQRQMLVEGSACPCCGSLHHPFTKDLPQLNNAIEKEYNIYKAAVNKLNEEFKTKTREQDRLEIHVKNIEKNILQFSQAAEETKTRLVNKLNLLGLPASTEKEAIDSAVLEAEENKRLIGMHREWQFVEPRIVAFIDDLKNYLVLTENFNGKKSERDNLYKGSSVGTMRNELSNSWIKTTTTIQSQKDALKAADTKISRLHNEIDSVNADLAVSIAKAGFEHADAFKNAMMDAATVQQIRKSIAEFNEKKSAHAGKKDQTSKNLQIEKEKDDATVSLEILTQEITEKKEIQHNNILRQGEIKKAIDVDTENKSRHSSILEEIEQKKKEESLYSILNYYIGDATGNTFNNIVQRITMKHLFGLANLRLETLMDRYQLELGKEADEDSIWVIDTYMGDEWRTIDSVSGGERFVISLALALALSDMASQNVRIDSMFIDEGFGSLSPDDLYNAINMLERMQVEGDKLVGIISHVESLKERIGIQIVVEKLQNGESTISLKYNDENNTLKLVSA
jgi:exonuclease SbcC